MYTENRARADFLILNSLMTSKNKTFQQARNFFISKFTSPCGNFSIYGYFCYKLCKTSHELV